MKPFLRSNASRLALRLLCTAALPLFSVSLASAQSDGTQDPAFADAAQANGSAHAITLQTDGQVLVGGSFTTFRGASRNSLARLRADGSLDTFNPGLAFSGYLGTTPSVQAVAVQADGKVLAAGSFTVLNQPGGGGVVRLNADGSLDASFNVGTGVVDDGGQVGTAYTVNVLPNGQILVGGAFATFNGVGTAGLVRLNADGSVDPGFNAGGAGITGNSYGRDVHGVVVQGDGRIVLGGHFSTYDGQSAQSVARLNANGTPDASFNVGSGVSDGGVFAVAVQGDGKVLGGGGYNTCDGISVAHLVRLNVDGSLDTGYAPNGSLFIGEVDALLVQPGGTVLAGGSFLSQGGLVNSPHNGLARLLLNGTQDATFNSGSNSRAVVALALQGNGRALVASNSNALTGTPTGDVYRYYDLSIPDFFNGAVALDNGVYYLNFPATGNYFGYYSFLPDTHYIFHFDLGYEYVFDAADGKSGVYFYDFKSNGFFYTSPGFPFPYLYDFSLRSTVYYYPDPSNAGHYNTNGTRYFYVFSTGQIISK